MQTPLFIAMGIAVLLALWILDRRRFARRLQSLSEQQRESAALLSAFMEESEKITLQLSRLICSNRLTPGDSSREQRDSTTMRRETECLQPKNNGVGKRHLVLGLAQRGRSVSQIAERLMMPVGEVELILNLNRTTRAVRTA
jgi:hypothetical protein